MAWDRPQRLLKVAGLALLGAAAGWLLGTVQIVRARLDAANRLDFLAQAFPLPHHVPARPDGIAFRFAMVHDVLVERYLKHDRAYFQAREVGDRTRLAHLAEGDAARFAAFDDLGVDLERLGRHDEAIALMRAKLAEQERAGLSGRPLYTTWADLGTFLIHASLRPALAGDRSARDQLGEGVAAIRRSVAVNPDAHFGRERWQANIAGFLGATLDNPDFLLRFDCLGNRLDLTIEQILDRDGANYDYGHRYGRAITPRFGGGEALRQVPAYFEPGLAVSDPARWAVLLPIREYVTPIGAEEGWDALAEPVPDHRSPVAFDGPMLGIIGMWRQGGGANPHFALAIGETMLRVGQRRIAWEAFERAHLLADRFTPDPAVNDRLRVHCRDRQQAIEATLNHRRTPNDRPHPWQEISPPRPDDFPDRLRARFDAELRFGLATQERYQDFERARLAAGVAVEDPTFGEGFDPGPTPLASRSGPEEWFQTVTSAAVDQYQSRYLPATTTLGAGLMAFLAALAGQLRRILRSRRLRLANSSQVAASSPGEGISVAPSPSATPGWDRHGGR